MWGVILVGGVAHRLIRDKVEERRMRGKNGTFFFGNVCCFALSKFPGENEGVSSGKRTFSKKKKRRKNPVSRVREHMGSFCDVHFFLWDESMVYGGCFFCICVKQNAKK